MAILQSPRRVWAISSVHGEPDPLATVHDRLFFRLEPGDRVVYLGNLLGWNNGIRDVVALVLGFRRAMLSLPGVQSCDLVFVRGAQEAMWQRLLQLQFASAPYALLRWMLDQGLAATVAAYGGLAEEGEAAAAAGPLAIARWTSQLRAAFHAAPGHAALLSVLRDAAHTELPNMLFVHAGLDPARALTDQNDILWWGGGFASIREPFGGFNVVVRGYDRTHPGIQTTPYTATIDGGCGFGGSLLAACFDAQGHIVDVIEGSG